jgi:hypothetical protein
MSNETVMNFNGKSFAQNSYPSVSAGNSFIERLRASKGVNGSQMTSGFNGFNGFNTTNPSIQTETQKELGYIERLRASRENTATKNTSLSFGDVQPTNIIPEQPTISSDDFIRRLAERKGQATTKSSYSSVLQSSPALQVLTSFAPQAQPEKEISQEEYIEQMRKRRAITESNTVTTLTLDVRQGEITQTRVIESILPIQTVVEDTNPEEEDDESRCEPREEIVPVDPKEILYQVRYSFATGESLKTTPSISKENMINFLNKQGANGGFDPVAAYNNTLSDSDKAQLKEETVRKNIGGGSVGEDQEEMSENQRIIEELGARRTSLTKAERKRLDQAEKDERARKKLDKEVAKALKGPSKKVQDMIAKKEVAKEEKVSNSDDGYLEKLSEELAADRIKTVYDAANWIIIISSPEKKLKGFELLFMAINEPVLKKIIYVEIMRRTTIEAVTSRKFKEALTRFSSTFTLEQMIKFQLKEMEDIIPPFSPFEKKKLSLDPWQLDVFGFINKKVSVLIDAPTASGKTVCATYCVKVCERVLFVLPSKELANQVAGVIRNMKSTNTNFTPIKLITGENIYEDNDPKVYIGTAVDLERYFNLEQAQMIRPGQTRSNSNQFDIDSFDYIIVDEIHQMNSPEQGCAMQRLIKRFKCPMLGLSATIGNPEQLKNWIEYLKRTTPSITVERVSYSKRFINQQKHVWNGSELVHIHPLAVVNLDFLQSGKLNRTEMQFIPNDLFKVYDRMESLYPQQALETIAPASFFPNACISLDQCKSYEIAMKQTLTELSHSYPTQTETLISSFRLDDFQLDQLGPKELYTVLKQMQHEKKLPSIVFKFDPTTCKKVANDLLEWMETEELLKYPLYRETRELQSRCYKEMKDKISDIDKMDFGICDDIKSDKLDCEIRERDKCLKHFIDEYKKLIAHNINKYRYELDERDISQERRSRLEFYITHYSKEAKNIEKMKELCDINVFAPHPDFTFSNITISMSTMIEIKNLLKEYTQQMNEVVTQETDKRKKKIQLTNNFNIGYNHFFLKSIERGFVLYLNALPVPFQRIGQMLIADGGAPVTFSDESLAFGVNYPIRSVALLGSTQNDIIDKAKADQASGRSGRRGLDTKGHTIYIGVNWRELTSSEYINITGCDPDNQYMTLPKEFNTKFEVKRLGLISLGEFCSMEDPTDVEALKALQKERFASIKETHMELIENLGNKNPMNIYRLSEYGELGEIITDFLVYLSSKMYSGVSIEQSDLFEMIGCLVDTSSDEDLIFSKEQNEELMYEFQSEMGERGIMVQLHGCNFLTKGYKKNLFEEKISQSMSRLRHINEIIRILYNQYQSSEKTHKWVNMLVKIFDQVKNLIFKNTI